MGPRVLKALESSICKWNNICMGHGTDNGTSDCALCSLFYIYNCNGCLVVEVSGEGSCMNTPYRAWDIAWDSFNDRGERSSYRGYIPISELPESPYKISLIIAAEAELIFLLELLPESHPWREMI